MAWNVTPSYDEMALLMEAGFICRDANNLNTPERFLRECRL